MAWRRALLLALLAGCGVKGPPHPPAPPSVPAALRPEPAPDAGPPPCCVEPDGGAGQ